MGTVSLEYFLKYNQFEVIFFLKYNQPKPRGEGRVAPMSRVGGSER